MPKHRPFVWNANHLTILWSLNRFCCCCSSCVCSYIACVLSLSSAPLQLFYVLIHNNHYYSLASTFIHPFIHAVFLSHERRLVLLISNHFLNYSSFISRWLYFISPLSLFLSRSLQSPDKDRPSNALPPWDDLGRRGRSKATQGKKISLFI